MKKLEKIKLLGNSTFLSESAMKNLIGGSAGPCTSSSGSCPCPGGGTGRCGKTKWPDGTFSYTCACVGIG